MKLTRRAATARGLSLLASSSLSTSSLADIGGEFLGIGEGLEDFWLATDAYIYGYPLVTMEMTRRVVTNVARPEGTKAPMGHIIKLRQYPTPAFTDVTAPNADTLYTTAFFDVGNEPWVLSIPDMEDRYALFPMLDGWTTVFQVPGKRTTGTAVQFKVNKDVKDINGFAFTTKTGIYGTDYLMRALVTAIGLGANRPQDAVYPTSLKDAEGKAYDGANKYVMHFPKGQLPPVRGFWSLTMYNDKYFFVTNPINRYSISARQNLKTNSDGSTDLYIQKDSPGPDKESNWLPAPAGKFILMLRMYWPNESSPSIINGSWKIPPVKKVA